MVLGALGHAPQPLQLGQQHGQRTALAQQLEHLVAVALAVCVWVAVWLWRTRPGRLAQLSAGLLVGGALGNVIDRVRFGYVVDFIDFYVGDWHYPTFNLADSFICVGAAMIVLEGFLSPANKGAKSKGE